MTTLTLFGTSACHLCELAEEMLLQWPQKNGPLDYLCVDISDSEELFERYGLLIPVLRHNDGRELLWPFDEASLAEFLDA